MRISNFKILLHISIFHLLVALWSESQCMHRSSSSGSSSSSSGMPSQRNRMMRPIGEEEITQYPHNAVLSLEATFEGDPKDWEKSEEKGDNKGKEKETERKASSRRGTGFLVGNQYILTAAHVVFSPICGFATTIKFHMNLHGHNQIKLVHVHKYVIPRSYIGASTLVYGPDKVQKAWDDHKAQNSPESFNEEKITKTPEELEKLAAHDYALLYLDEPINDVMPIIPFAYYMVADNEPFFDQNVMLCGYPALKYRFSQQFVSGLVKAKEEAMADMEVIRLDKKDNTFQYTTLDGKKVKRSFNPSFKMIDIDILNKNEDAQEEVLNKIFEIGYQDRLYPAIGLTPYETDASLVKKTRDLMMFDTPSYHGMSGSPIRFTFPSLQPMKWYASAILSQGNKLSAVGCRFTQKKIELIAEWKEVIPMLTPELIKDMNAKKHAAFKIIEEESIIKTAGKKVVEGASGVGQYLASALSTLTSLDWLTEK